MAKLNKNEEVEIAEGKSLETRQQRKAKVAEKDSQSKIEELEKELEVVKEEHTAVCEKLETELKDAKNDYYKAYADTENIKKRLQQEADMVRKYRIQSFALEILPAIDALEKALEQEVADEGYKKGIEMIYSQLSNALKNEGVEEIEALNKPFDANFHHAIMQEKVEGVESNMVIEVFQKGYKLKDRILRATLVKVSE